MYSRKLHEGRAVARPYKNRGVTVGMPNGASVKKAKENEA
jgi:hypothetical protein